MKEQSLESGIINAGKKRHGGLLDKIVSTKKHNSLEFHAIQTVTQTPAIENEISSFTEFLF